MSSEFGITRRQAVRAAGAAGALYLLGPPLAEAIADAPAAIAAAG
jgi:hypothetical protein